MLRAHTHVNNIQINQAKVQAIIYSSSSCNFPYLNYNFQDQTHQSSSNSFSNPTFDPLSPISPPIPLLLPEPTYTLTDIDITKLTPCLPCSPISYFPPTITLDTSNIQTQYQFLAGYQPSQMFPLQEAIFGLSCNDGGLQTNVKYSYYIIASAPIFSINNMLNSIEVKSGTGDVGSFPVKMAINIDLVSPGAFVVTPNSAIVNMVFVGVQNQLATLSKNTKDANIYQLEQKGIHISLDDHEKNSVNILEVKYVISNTEQISILPDFITWDQNSLILYLSPTLNTNPGLYNISFTLFDQVEKSTDFLSILVLKAVLPNKSPPLFTEPLESSLRIFADTLFTYPLPPLYDIDNDAFTMIIVSLPQTFCQYKQSQDNSSSSGELKFKPQERDVQPGYYQVKLKVTDNNIAQKSEMHTIKVYVLSSKVEQQQKEDAQISKTSIPSAAIRDSKFGARIKDIGYEGLMTIRFSQRILMPAMKNYSEDINSTLINISVRQPSHKDYSDKMENIRNKSILFWNVTELNQLEMKIQINFTDPSSISPRLTEEDTIDVEFLADWLFISAARNIYFPKNYTISSEIPRQIVFTKQIIIMQNAAQIGVKTMMVAVIGNVVLQVFLSLSMHMIWGMMNTLQLIGIMLKFNLIVPSNAFLFFLFIEEFLNMKAQFINDILLTIREKLFGISSSISEGLGAREQSSNVIRNLGTFILVGIGLLCAMIIAIALIYLPEKWTVIAKLVTIVKQKLFYNSVLRTAMQSYFKFTLVGFTSIQFSSKQFATGIPMLIFAAGFPLFCFVFLRRYRTQLAEATFQLRFSSLYLNINTSLSYATILTTLFLLRRLALSVVLTFLEDYPFLQIAYMNLTTSMMISYLTRVRPLTTSYLNNVEIFNEIILSLCTFVTVVFTDYCRMWKEDETQEKMKIYAKEEKDIRDIFGWIYIGLACLCIIVSMIGILFAFFNMICTKLSQICQALVKRAKKEPKSQYATDLNKQGYQQNVSKSINITKGINGISNDSFQTIIQHPYETHQKQQAVNMIQVEQKKIVYNYDNKWINIYNEAKMLEQQPPSQQYKEEMFVESFDEQNNPIQEEFKSNLQEEVLPHRRVDNRVIETPQRFGVQIVNIYEEYKRKMRDFELDVQMARRMGVVSYTQQQQRRFYNEEEEDQKGI